MTVPQATLPSLTARHSCVCILFFVCLWTYSALCITSFNIFLTELIARLKGYNELRKTSCDVGMYFGNFRFYSVKIGNLKKFRVPSGKRRVYSISGRHNDDRWRNVPSVFQKASETFLFFRSLPSSYGKCRSTCRHRTKFFEVHYTPFTLNADTINSTARY